MTLTIVSPIDLEGGGQLLLETGYRLLTQGTWLAPESGEALELVGPSAEPLIVEGPVLRHVIDVGP